MSAKTFDLNLRTVCFQQKSPFYKYSFFNTSFKLERDNLQIKGDSVTPPVKVSLF